MPFEHDSAEPPTRAVIIGHAPHRGRRTPAAREVVRRDVGRYARLVDDDWRTDRYTKYEVYGEPREIITQLTRARQRSSGT